MDKLKKNDFSDLKWDVISALLAFLIAWSLCLYLDLYHIWPEYYMVYVAFESVPVVLIQIGIFAVFRACRIAPAGMMRQAVLICAGNAVSCLISYFLYQGFFNFVFEDFVPLSFIVMFAVASAATGILIRSFPVVLLCGKCRIDMKTKELARFTERADED